MLVIRFARTGRSKYPTYRIVAAESARPVTGKFVAILGHYNPHTKEVVLNQDEILKHLANGAQPSNSVAKLLQREKVKLPEWVKLKTRNRPAKKEPVVKEPKPEAAPEVADEAPTEAAETAETSSEADESPIEETVATTAEANAEAVADATTESAPEDTAAGEEAQADKAAESSDAAAEAASPPAEDQPAE